MEKVECGSQPLSAPRCSPGTRARQWKCSRLTVPSRAGAGYPRRTGGGTERGCTALLVPVPGVTHLPAQALPLRLPAFAAPTIVTASSEVQETLGGREKSFKKKKKKSFFTFTVETL